MALFKKSLEVLSSDKVLTIIGPEAYFHGAITAKGSIRIEGQVEGSVTEAQTVILGAGGKMRGDIVAERVVLSGRLRGNVTAGQMLEILGGAILEGDIRTPKLVIEEGAVFDGRCAMTSTLRSPRESAKPVEPEPAEA